MFAITAIRKVNMAKKQQMTQRQTLQGFTIIEVVLVLAIAGLIFLMVFIALPSMQRSQRDTQRRNDYAQLSTSVTNYMTNHNGGLPISTSGTTTAINGCVASFINNHPVNTTDQDPNGQPYSIFCSSDRSDATTRVSESFTNGGSPIVYVVQNASCDENGELVGGTGRRSFAVYAQLESGTYCQSSS